MSLLENINLTDEQKKDFVARLDAWKENQKTVVSKEIETKYKEKLNEAQDIIVKIKKESETNLTKNRITEKNDLNFSDAETSILKEQLTKFKESVQEETENKLGDKFFESFKEGKEKLKKEYSDKFINTIKDVYEDVEKSVREKLIESGEFKAFSQLKKVLAPFIVEGEYTDTVYEDNKKLKDIIQEQTQKLENVKIKTKLDQLMASMPKTVREDFVETLGDFKSEDELIEAYQKQIKLMKNVKETLLTELNESQDVATDEGGEKPAEEAPASEEKPAEKAPEKPEEKPAEKKEELKENKEPTQKSEESKSPVEKVDYDILSEDFKRKEEKKSAIDRLRYLAGVND